MVMARIAVSDIRVLVDSIIPHRYYDTLLCTQLRSHNFLNFFIFFANFFFLIKYRLAGFNRLVAVGIFLSHHPARVSRRKFSFKKRIHLIRGVKLRGGPYTET